VARGELAPERARQALQDLADLPCERYPHDFLLLRAGELRQNLPAYDAVYVALAEILGATLLTCDESSA
jgi:predicted nucleic acid-binding protein